MLQHQNQTVSFTAELFMDEQTTEAILRRARQEIAMRQVADTERSWSGVWHCDADSAIRGLHSVTIAVRDPRKTIELMTSSHTADLPEGGLLGPGANFGLMSRPGRG